MQESKLLRGFFGKPLLISLVLLVMSMPGCHRATPYPALVSPSGKGDIHITISGLRNDDGQLIVSLFASESGFPEDVNLSLVTSNVRITKHHAEVVFRDTPYGNYAVSVLHDENLDEKMGTSLFGTPQEGFSFSGYPSYRFGRPHFDETSFLLTSTERKLELFMRYETGRNKHQKSARLKKRTSEQIVAGPTNKRMKH